MKYIFLFIVFSLIITGCIWNDPNQVVNSDQTNDNGANSSSTDNIPASDGLDLSNQNLSQVPAYVFDRTNLEELNISHNRLTGAIPAEIRQLKNLRILDASDNQMTGVPAEIGQLNNLEKLDLSNNQLTGLPYELGNLSNLKILDLSGNNYSQLDLDIISQNLPATVNIITQ
ncbi:MAG: leucine-rich repeat domain-containing protein [Patescibacteria group bacterium]